MSNTLLTEFFNQFLCTTGQFLRSVDGDGHEKVTALIAHLHSFFADTQDIPAFDAGGDGERYRSVECHDGVRGAEKRIGQFDGKRRSEMHTLSHDGSMLLHMYFDIQVPRSAASHRLSAAGHANHLAVFDSGGYLELDFFFTFKDASAAACCAGDFWNCAAPAAHKASAHGG